MLDFEVHASSALWTEDREPTPRPFPARPQVKNVVIAVALPGHRLALRKGTDPRISASVQDTAKGAAAYCLSLMDGSRSRSAIEIAMRKCHPEVSSPDLDRFVNGLNSMGMIEEAAVEVPADLSSDDLHRYSRNINCWSAMPSDFASKYHVQAQLHQATVLVLGVGGIGSNCALGLSMLGVGHLVLVDHDCIELQNLNRQVLYDTTSIGKSKVEVAGERLRAVNPSVNVIAIPQRIESSIAIQDLIKQFEPQIVVLAADRPAEAIDRWTSDACAKANVPYVTGAVSGASGQVWSKVPGLTSCEECDRLWLRDTAPDSFDMLTYREEQDLIPATSAISFGAQVIGGLMGFDILRHLLGASMVSAGHIIAVDFFKMLMTRDERPSHPDCTVCQLAPQRQEKGPEVWNG